MSELAKIQILEAENRRLKSELHSSRELIKKLEQQRDGLYWEYETIRYKMNEQLTDRSPSVLGE